MQSWSFKPIGWVESCFKEKFGIPRQPGLVPSVESVLRLDPSQPFLRQALRRIEEFSHLWVLTVFHEHGAHDWKPSIRPPRLGGAEKVGVLASRSPHRPNPIGLSAVEIARVDVDDPKGAAIYVRGGDFLDQTPILDIKPYIPYADAISGASAGWAEAPIERVPVRFAPKALDQIEAAAKSADLRKMITQVLELDPRPAFQKRRLPPSSPEAQGLEFGFDFLEYDIKWRIEGGEFVVLDLVVRS
jgi:tRNA-Thr(GGU) m(6)t(6)A37 methyltransferase TsaA